MESMLGHLIHHKVTAVDKSSLPNADLKTNHRQDYSRILHDYNHVKASNQRPLMRTCLRLVATRTVIVPQGTFVSKLF